MRNQSPKTHSTSTTSSSCPSSFDPSPAWTIQLSSTPEAAQLAGGFSCSGGVGCWGCYSWLLIRAWAIPGSSTSARRVFSVPHATQYSVNIWTHGGLLQSWEYQELREDLVTRCVTPRFPHPASCSCAVIAACQDVMDFLSEKQHTNTTHCCLQQLDWPCSTVETTSPISNLILEPRAVCWNSRNSKNWCQLWYPAMMSWAMLHAGGVQWVFRQTFN